MSMQDPVCPYCGQPMRLDADSCHIWMKCDNCLSSSPKVDRPDKNEFEPAPISWFLYWSKCNEGAISEIHNHQNKKRQINKPLTKAEIFQLIAAGEYFVAYYEETEASGICAALWKGEKGIDEIYLITPANEDKFIELLEKKINMAKRNTR